MRADREHEVIVPWYRQFWPWFLIALPGSVVIASIITLFIAADKPDTVVVDDYYKQGLAINTDLSRDQLARDLGIQAALDIHDEQIRIVLTSPHQKLPGTLLLHLLHPTLADRDQKLTLRRIGENTYVARIYPLSNGAWNVRIEGGKPSWRLQKRLLITDSKIQYNMP